MNIVTRLMRLGVVLGVAMLMAMPARAGVSNPSAKAFLSEIYKSYIGSSGQQAKGIPLTSVPSIHRYFSPGLASLIIDEGADAARRGQPIVLGSDPFVGHEEWQISDLSIDVKESGPTKAIGTVTFTNFGQKEKIVLELLKVGNDWRITEIQWGPLTLRTLYRRKWQAQLGASQLPR